MKNQGPKQDHSNFWIGVFQIILGLVVFSKINNFDFVESLLMRSSFIPNYITLGRNFTFIIYTLLCIFSGIGIFYRKKWGWFIAGIMTVISILPELTQFVIQLTSWNYFSVPLGFKSVLYLINLFLLFKSNVFSMFFDTKAKPKDEVKKKIILLSVIISVGLFVGFNFPQFIIQCIKSIGL
jgi:hypothetical protein